MRRSENSPFKLTGRQRALINPIALAQLFLASLGIWQSMAFVPLARQNGRSNSASFCQRTFSSSIVRIRRLTHSLSCSVPSDATHFTEALSETSHSTCKRNNISNPLERNDINFWRQLCDLEVPEGRCVGLNLREFDPDEPDSLEPEAIACNSSHWIHSLLHPDEVTFGIKLPSKARRETFLIGRIAVRAALGILREPRDSDSSNEIYFCQGIPAILKDEHGRPTMPKGFLGSISHKDRAGVGIVTNDLTYTSPDDPPQVGIGIDLERTNNPRSIARRVLTENEIKALGHVEGVTVEEEVMLRFSLKECIYKAVHPLIGQYIGFKEAEVTPLSNGTATVCWNLKTGAHVRLADVTAHWQRLDGGDYFLSSSSAYLRRETESDREL